MRGDGMHSGGTDRTGAQLTPPPPRHLGPRAGQDDPGTRPARHRLRTTTVLICGAVALFAIFLRISNSFPLDSDAANNALQAWDMLHGNLLLHGWIIGDATYYTFELPLYAIVESVLGLHPIVTHVVSALVYVIVAACAMAVARTGSRGLSRWVRYGVVLALLAAPLLNFRSVSIAVEKPDHTGTAAIMLLCFLLIDRAAGRRFMPPLLCALLVAGQISDATVLYVAVPAIILVCAYRMLTARKARPARRRSRHRLMRWFSLLVRQSRSIAIRSVDSAVLVATAVSIPLSLLIRSLMLHIGAYWMVSPQNRLAGWSQIPHNGMLTLKALGILFGVIEFQGTVLGIVTPVFGGACALAALYGFGKVIRHWRTASRAEQFLCVAIVVNIAAYIFSTIPVASNARELIAVVPFSAVLAARALVPERITAGLRARVAVAAAAAVAVLLPLTAAASVPTATPEAAALAAWLEAHGLKYGVAGYWNASAVTLVSGNKVQVRTVGPRYFGIAAKDWETKAFWYDPTRHYATFAIADISNSTLENNIPAAVYEQYFGQPVSIHKVADKLILIYRQNLLQLITGPLAVPPPPAPTPAVSPTPNASGAAATG